MFETLRGTLPHLPLHLARLRAGADALRIPLTWSDADIAAAAQTVAASLPDCVIRITLTRGPGPRGVLPTHQHTPSLLITAAPLPPPPPPGRAIVAQTTRRNEHSPLARIKSLNYLDSIIARQEAADAGADDAILRNTAGNFAEATAGNLFLHLPDGWATPPIPDGALPGITRSLILRAGLATERTLHPTDLAHADAAFISSALWLRLLTHIDVNAMALADLSEIEKCVRSDKASLLF